MNATDTELRNPMISSYIACIVSNFNRHNDKENKIGIATASLFISFLLIGIATSIILSLYQNRSAPTIAIPEKAYIEGKQYED